MGGQGFSKVVGGVCNPDLYGMLSVLSRLQTAPTPHQAFSVKGKWKKALNGRGLGLPGGFAVAALGVDKAKWVGAVGVHYPNFHGAFAI